MILIQWSMCECICLEGVSLKEDVYQCLKCEPCLCICSMKLDKAPTESYADIGGLEQQIQEIKVCDILFTVQPPQ